MNDKKYLVIDFDSTFLKVEGLEELAAISLSEHPEKSRLEDEIKNITCSGVDGKLPFHESLGKRLDIIRPHKKHLDELVPRLKQKVSDSISHNKEFFENFKEDIYIISAGFREFIIPVVEEYNIDPDHVYANSFVYDEEGNITGYDENNPLAYDHGKSKVLRTMGLDGEISVVGDSYTDYEMKEAGVAHKFFAFTENVLRENILGKADHVVRSFDEVLYINDLPMRISYPKSRIKVLLLENIHSDAENFFVEEGYEVETIGRALSEEELCEKIKGVFILGIRSKTHVTAKVLEAANRLMVVGAFCIGTNQIDLEACARHGVIAFNAPYSNTRSVVELAISHMISLIRRIPEMNKGMHEGKWNKSASNSYEIRGKKLGIIGYGNIGAQLSVLAEAMGMDVYYYDVVEKLALGNATKVKSLKELLQLSDIVSLHIDGRESNRNAFGEECFAEMKPGSIFINLSRGFVVDIDALKRYLDNGHLRGAAIDVFPKEPKSNQEEFESVLRGYNNVILTPHIGGSTQEAQQNIGEYVPSRIVDYINTGSSFGSVNFPVLQLPRQGNAHRLIHIHENVPGILAKINNILAINHQINILGQYLKTDENTGYVITDIDKKYDQEVLEDLKQIEQTIKFRVLY